MPRLLLFKVNDSLDDHLSQVFDLHRIDQIEGEINIVDYDVIMVDLGDVRAGALKWIMEKQQLIYATIQNSGAALVGIADLDIDLPGISLTKAYNWIIPFNQINVERSTTLQISFDSGNSLGVLDGFHAKDYKGKVIFKNYQDEWVAARDPATHIVALCSSYGEGYSLILPSIIRAGEFAESLSLVLGRLSDKFRIGSAETAPDFVQNELFQEQREISVKVDELQGRIITTKQEIDAFKKVFSSYEKIKRLLWAQGIELEEAVKDAFQILGINLVRHESVDVDWVGEYSGRRIVIEVKGRQGAINHKEDYRQISERVSYDFVEENPKGVLVGNPYRLKPLEERLDNDEEPFFSSHSLIKSEQEGITLMTSVDLFRIVKDFKDGKINLEDKERCLKEIFNSSKGRYAYQKIT